MIIVLAAVTMRYPKRCGWMTAVLSIGVLSAIIGIATIVAQLREPAGKPAGVANDVLMDDRIFV